MWDLDVRLEGELVTLEPLRAEHEDALFEAGQPEEIWTWWPLNPTESRETMHAYIESSLEAARNRERQHYTTFDANTGEAIGSTSYCLIQPEHKVVEIGWTWLRPSHWGTGANVEALGAQLEGIHRDDRIVRDNVRRSSAVYSVLDSEWLDVRDRLTERLKRDGSKE